MQIEWMDTQNLSSYAQSVLETLEGKEKRQRPNLDKINIVGRIAPIKDKLLLSKKKS